MEKPPEIPTGPSLAEVVWNQMSVGEDPKTRCVSEGWIAEMYEVGVVDRKRFRITQWQAVFAKIPKGEKGYQVGIEDFKKLIPFFFPAKVKKPFETVRLKDGGRPVAWLTDLYQKVLRFETNLNLAAWNKLLQEQIKPRFTKGDKFLLNPAFRQWLEALLAKEASPLRKLELWYDEKSKGGPAPPVPAEGQEKAPTKWESGKSTFDAKPSEGQKKAAIDQVFYHQEQHPTLDDKDSLDFLDQLAEIPQEDSELP